jgi:hypothetical protein
MVIFQILRLNCQTNCMKKVFLLAIIICSLFFDVNGQAKLEKVKAFVDCSQTWICNSDYIRSEITMVDFVRDRRDADVHVLVTAQNSNAGGVRGQLSFIGLRSFQNVNDTLSFFNDPTSTEDQQRKKMVQHLKLGLMKYISKSKIAEDVTISYTAKAADKKDTAKTKDPWNYWVFQVSTYGSFSGSETYKYKSLNASFSATRETDKWKSSGQFSLNKSVETYIDTSGKTKFTRQGLDGSFDAARVLNKHWAVGVEASYSNSLYSNLRAAYKLRPKVEYSFLPYSKFNTERIVFQYSIGPTANYYYDTTVYLKINEWQFQQSAYLITSFTKPWGAINTGIFYSNYMNDFTKNNLSFNGAITWKIVKGLNFALWGNYGVVHDQIALRKGNVSRDDLLVKTRELKSNYNYSLGVAFSYRFGSILNNFINPSFRGLNYSINI